MLLLGLLLGHWQRVQPLLEYLATRCANSCGDGCAVCLWCDDEARWEDAQLGQLKQ